MRSPSTCPDCGKDGKVRRVSVVIDGGTTSTTASALTSTVRGSDVRVTSTAATTTSALAGRFTPRPPRPLPVGVVVAPFGFVAFVATAGVFSRLPDVALLAAVLVTVAVCVLLRRRWGPRRAASRALWEACLERVRSGYYCRRDDVAFDADHARVGPPEVFTAWCFEPFVERT